MSSEKECVLLQVNTSTLVKNLTVYSILLGFVVCLVFVVVNAFILEDKLFIEGGDLFTAEYLYIALNSDFWSFCHWS